MSQGHLGLFDTPPNRRQIRLGLAIVGGLFVALFLILPVRDIRLREIDAFIPVLDAVMFADELIIATLLYAQAGLFRSRALTVLASGYVLTALLLVPHALSFPGAFAPDGLLGGSTNATAWLAVFRRIAFPLGIALYALLKRAEMPAKPGMARPIPSIALGVYAALALAAAATMLATIGADLLPPVFANRTEPVYANLFWINALTIILSIVAMALLWRRKSVLDLWLLVALSGWLVQSLLNLTSGARYAVGWYGLVIMMLASSLVVMVALIAESHRLHARLALTTAARDRERDARLMSIDAVTAAIAHEIGQPLTGTIASAMAGLSWLTGNRPDRERAINALHDAIDAGNRTRAVIRSIRAMFATEPGTPTQVCLNQLVRETAALLDRELAGEKVALEFNLDKALPPIVADRIQIQRVLVNLFANAIDSVGATRGRPRRIAIRSAPLNGEDVLLEIKDTGIGIEPEAMTRIFEPFFTTKRTGTGLGLSLCRTIVEEHGGRLWATSGEPQGATFHLQLPRNGLAEP